jgi:hypothetical protein
MVKLDMETDFSAFPAEAESNPGNSDDRPRWSRYRRLDLFTDRRPHSLFRYPARRLITRHHRAWRRKGEFKPVTRLHLY